MFIEEKLGLVLLDHKRAADICVIMIPKEHIVFPLMCSNYDAFLFLEWSLLRSCTIPGGRVHSSCTLSHNLHQHKTQINIVVCHSCCTDSLTWNLPPPNPRPFRFFAFSFNFCNPSETKSIKTLIQVIFVHGYRVRN